MTPSFCLRWNIVFIYSHKIGACCQRDVNAHFGVLFLVVKFGVKVTVRRGCCSDVAGHEDAQNYLQFWVSPANVLVLCLSSDEELVLARAVCARQELFPQDVDVRSSSLVSPRCELAQWNPSYQRAGFHLAGLKCLCCGHL